MSRNEMDYKLIDSGNEEKLEQFKDILLIRPAPTALWRPSLPKSIWSRAQARFVRDPYNQWEVFKPMPESWEIEVKGVRLKLKRTDFGHLGFFAEHSLNWQWMTDHPLEGRRILNLFAYSGSSTIALAKAGAHVTHLDAAKGMVQWARENSALNGLQQAPIRWIVDDVRKYLARAIRREERYDAILLDPPSFGRGKGQEIFKINYELIPLLESCRELLSDDPLFVLLTCHTPLYTPLALGQLVRQTLGRGFISHGEMAICGPFDLPCGSYVRWTP